jgi:hypothetical protein
VRDYVWKIKADTLEQRLLRHVGERRRGRCWLWVGAKSDGGYGIFGWRRKLYIAHRAAWEVWRGAIPAGKCVLHSCDVPACVNPAHLRIGTHADNARDKVVRGRWRTHGWGAGDGLGERLLSSIERCGGHWLWKMGCDRDGQPVIGFGGRHLRAHRAAYGLWRGEIAPGMAVAHSCGEWRCINPAHLELKRHGRGTFTRERP